MVTTVTVSSQKMNLVLSQMLWEAEKEGSKKSADGGDLHRTAGTGCRVYTRNGK